MRRVTIRRPVDGAVAFGFLAIAAGPLISQTPAAPGQASLHPSVQVVSLDLVVRDRHNKPLLDLKPDQVTVTDNGKPATLTDLRLVNGTPQNEPLITLLFDRPGMDDPEEEVGGFRLWHLCFDSAGNQQETPPAGVEISRRDS